MTTYKLRGEYLIGEKFVEELFFTPLIFCIDNYDLIAMQWYLYKLASSRRVMCASVAKACYLTEI